MPSAPTPAPDLQAARKLIAAGDYKKALITLEQIKADAQLGDWDLVRLPRLSVVPVTPAQWRRVEELSGTGRAE